MRNIIHWRGEAEAALRASGQPYTIVRPSWLTDDAGGRQALRLEQGDSGEGRVARVDVATVKEANTVGSRFQHFAMMCSPLYVVVIPG